MTSGAREMDRQEAFTNKQDPPQRLGELPISRTRLVDRRNAKGGNPEMMMSHPGF